MPFYQCKIYNDGSHFIAIIPTKQERRKRRKIKEDLIEVEMPKSAVNADMGTSSGEKVKMSKREYFNELYKEHVEAGKSRLVDETVKAMEPYFGSREETLDYVNRNVKRKRHNMTLRKIRLSRKMALQEFNYFCTFTYDDKKHTEDSFRKKLKTTFWNLSSRQGWKYIGVWERSPEKQRLHFHGLFYIPEMVGELTEVKDYDTRRQRAQVTVQNTYFNERFGRSDFKRIEDNGNLEYSVQYIMKYMEKTGERMVFSKNLPQYFISDILDEDVMCRVGDEEEKLLLYDNFTCIDEGMFMGQVSKKVIEKMPKGN